MQTIRKENKMTKETKVKLLQVILNAGIKGTDREMLDNLKAVIKAIENEDGKGDILGGLPPAFPIIAKVSASLQPSKKKAGRPKKR